MKLNQLNSGSSGNLYEVTASNGKRIMLECGVTWPKLQKALDYDISRFEGCLVTHQHKDHSKSLAEIMQAGIDTYAVEDVFESQDLSGHRRAKVIRNKDMIKFDSFQVFVFDLSHDVPIVGFIIHENQTGEKLLFCTDTFYVMRKNDDDDDFTTYKFKHKFDIIALECSYNRDILTKLVDTGEVNEVVAKRLLTSHMEKENTKTYIRDYCDLSKCREIHLLHLSGLNIDKWQTQKEFREEFFIKTVIVGDE